MQHLVSILERHYEESKLEAKDTQTLALRKLHGSVAVNIRLAMQTLGVVADHHLVDALRIGRCGDILTFYSRIELYRSQSSNFEWL